MIRLTLKGKTLIGALLNLPPHIKDIVAKRKNHTWAVEWLEDKRICVLASDRGRFIEVCKEYGIEPIKAYWIKDFAAIHKIGHITHFLLVHKDVYIQENMEFLRIQTFKHFGRNLPPTDPQLSLAL